MVQAVGKQSLRRAVWPDGLSMKRFKNYRKYQDKLKNLTDSAWRSCHAGVNGVRKGEAATVLDVLTYITQDGAGAPGRKAVRQGREIRTDRAGPRELILNR
jgi:hypothetical protein